MAIVQSCYIPWKGYFDLMNSVDEFVVYDQVQYTRQDWRNRNRIKTATGTKWLTIPVTVRGLYEQRLDETAIADPSWTRRHWDSIRQAYRRAPHFSTYADRIERAYDSCRSEPLLSRVNRVFLDVVCELLEIETTLTRSIDYQSSGTATEKVVDLCRAAGAAAYVSGPRAQTYIDPTLFEQAGIELEYFDYDGYPEYTQLYPPFEHSVTVLDLILHAGPEAPGLMKTFTPRGAVG